MSMLLRSLAGWHADISSRLAASLSHKRPSRPPFQPRPNAGPTTRTDPRYSSLGPCVLFWPDGGMTTAGRPGHGVWKHRHETERTLERPDGVGSRSANPADQLCGRSGPANSSRDSITIHRPTGVDAEGRRAPATERGLLSSLSQEVVVPEARTITRPSHVNENTAS